MARPIERELYQALRNSSFDFVVRGTYASAQIYDFVKNHYPTLCDDEYRCIDNCSRGSIQPEWKHVVRKALYSFKIAKIASIQYTNKSWVFN